MSASRASLAWALALVIGAAGCYQAHERGERVTVDAAQADTALADDASVTTHDASVLADDAFVSTETLYTMTTRQCFTFATRAILDGDGMRCGDFTLEGDFVAYLVGIDGTLCELAGSYTSLASIPTSVGSGGCGRVINLQVGDGTHLGFLVRLDGHVYRVHVWSSTPPTMVFSFDEVG